MYVQVLRRHIDWATKTAGFYTSIFVRTDGQFSDWNLFGKSKFIEENAYAAASIEQEPT